LAPGSKAADVHDAAPIIIRSKSCSRDIAGVGSGMNQSSQRRPRR